MYANYQCTNWLMFIVLWNSLVEEIIKELTRHGRCCHSGHYNHHQLTYLAIENIHNRFLFEEKRFSCDQCGTRTPLKAD
jgi:hypothetical protein